MQIGTLMFELQDTTLTGFESIERHMKLLIGSRLLVKPGTASREQGNAWVSYMGLQLKDIWEQTLRCVRAHAIGTRLVKTGNRGEVLEFKRDWHSQDFDFATR